MNSGDEPCNNWWVLDDLFQECPELNLEPLRQDPTRPVINYTDESCSDPNYVPFPGRGERVVGLQEQQRIDGVVSAKIIDFEPVIKPAVTLWRRPVNPEFLARRAARSSSISSVGLSKETATLPATVRGTIVNKVGSPSGSKLIKYLKIPEHWSQQLTNADKFQHGVVLEFARTRHRPTEQLTSSGVQNVTVDQSSQEEVQTLDRVQTSFASSCRSDSTEITKSVGKRLISESDRSADVDSGEPSDDVGIREDQQANAAGDLQAECQPDIEKSRTSELQTGQNKYPISPSDSSAKEPDGKPVGFPVRFDGANCVPTTELANHVQMVTEALDGRRSPSPEIIAVIFRQPPDLEGRTFKGPTVRSRDEDASGGIDAPPMKKMDVCHRSRTEDGSPGRPSGYHVKSRSKSPQRHSTKRKKTVRRVHGNNSSDDDEDYVPGKPLKYKPTRRYRVGRASLDSSVREPMAYRLGSLVKESLLDQLSPMGTSKRRSSDGSQGHREPSRGELSGRDLPVHPLGDGGRKNSDEFLDDLFDW